MMMNRILLSRFATRKLVQTNFKSSLLLPYSTRSFADVAVVGQQAKTEIES